MEYRYKTFNGLNNANAYKIETNTNKNKVIANISINGKPEIYMNKAYLEELTSGVILYTHMAHAHQTFSS